MASQKLLVQMSGPPGSGKSTLANLLAHSINGIVINHDLIKSFFLTHENDFNQAAKLAYDLDRLLAEDMMKQGRNVILDSVCNYDEVLEKGAALAQKYGFEFKFVECRVEDVEVLDRRMRGRTPMGCQRRGVYEAAPGTSAAHEEKYRELFKERIKNPLRPQRGVIVVDATRSSEECLRDVIEQLSLGST